MRATQSELLARHRIRPIEALPWLLALAVPFLFPSYLPMASAIVVMALFALSLDLVLGFAGIVTLGHAVFFGTGAYLAGLLSLAGFKEPLSAALLAGLGSALLALVTGPLILRLSTLPLIMVTLAFSMIVYEAANKATWLTGGDDGLAGVEFDPVFGIFRWSVYGHTSYFYALGWLFVLFVTTRLLVASPFGVALQGIRENAQRMTLIGGLVLRHLVRAYVISGFVAGIAGAISAQTTKFVSLDVLSINKSIDVLTMLVLGGVGRLYGALLGAPVYMLVHNFASEWNPYHWMFVVGALLILVVRFARGGLLGLVDAFVSWLGRIPGRPKT
jgi:branched-chain amino acid transport system permease protein